MSIYNVGSVLDSLDIEAVERIIGSSQPLTRGEVVGEFERQLGFLLSAEYVSACSSCSAALRMAYQSLDLQARPRRVVAQVNSFWNTLTPLVEFSCPIDFVDCEPDSLSISTVSLKEYLENSREPAEILVVTEMGGHSSDHRALRQLADSYGLTVVVDCAHALGTSYCGKSVATYADISCYSFSSLKNICTLGEGGAVATNVAGIAEKIRKLRECWPIGRYESDTSLFASYFQDLSNEDMLMLAKHLRPGTALTGTVSELTAIGANFKITSPQAAVGLTQLVRLERFNSRRAEIAGMYCERLKGTVYEPILPRDKSISSWHLFNVVRKESNLRSVLRILNRLSLESQFDHVNRYWPACDLSAIRRAQRYNFADYPNYANLFFGRLLSLPINPKMQDSDVLRVLEIVMESECSH
jgi:perosamine synthetase